MNKGRLAIFSIVMMVGVFYLSGARVAQPSAEGDASYNANKVYAGVFEPRRIYKKNFGSDFWTGSRKPAFIEAVFCSEARAMLSKAGHWKGRLRADGSCGGSRESNEPVDWAVGNFLNYEATPEE